MPNFLRMALARIILCCLAAAALPSCVKLPRRNAHLDARLAQAIHDAESTPRLSINEATREELERLPGVGPALAARIVEHRERHGRFRRAEHLLLVRGISERRFRQLRPYVKADADQP